MVASDIVTVRECVGAAFSFAEKVEQSVFLRWDSDMFLDVTKVIVQAHAHVPVK